MLLPAQDEQTFHGQLRRNNQQLEERWDETEVSLYVTRKYKNVAAFSI